jgi:peptidoglycan/xylan/chitin deacetylase (PgdA/CDA1 family)
VGAIWRQRLWRIIRTLDRHSVPATGFCSEKSAELYLEVIAQAGRSGHDIAGHGYTQDGLFAETTPEEERAAIRKTVDLLESASGIRALGWATPGLQLDRAHLRSAGSGGCALVRRCA